MDRSLYPISEKFTALVKILDTRDVYWFRWTENEQRYQRP